MPRGERVTSAITNSRPPKMYAHVALTPPKPATDGPMISRIASA
jgi:hypothetical protein